MIYQRIFLILFTLCFFVVDNEVYASIKIEGEFIASTTCEAYVSFRKQTNPGHVRLNDGMSYAAIELNKAEASWYRIRIQEAKPRERWISADCGELILGSKPSVIESKVSVCTTPGLEDSYKLALSWHPAFCETKPDKPECKTRDASLYRAQNFTLHGLWPNKKSCGIDYGFCGEVGQAVKPFCNYPELVLTEHTRLQLNAVMPSAAEGTCLQRHEWFKHGTCQDDWDVNEYYEVSVRLTREFNESGVAQWMQSNVGKTVTTDNFQWQVDNVLGPRAHRRLQLTCKKGNLVDVYINLPKFINEKQPLAVLIANAAEDYSNNCGRRFRIDPIGVGH